ncbi:MAG: T9SS type A sorting domain-containing protein [Bacteroidales bacterium]
MRKLCLLVVCILFVSNNLAGQKLLESVVSYFYPTERDSFKIWKEVYEYNSAGKKASLARYTWDSRRNGWVGGMFPAEECFDCPGKFEYSYDKSGNQVLTDGFYWGFQNKWVVITRQESGFDAYGNRVCYSFNRWSDEKKDWIPIHGQEYGYDEAGHTTSDAVYFWDTVKKAWNPYQKEEFFFNDQGKQTMYLRFLWDASRRDWTYHTKSEWTYDSLGTQTLYANFAWTWVKKEYVWKEADRKKTEYVYDSAGNQVSSTVYNWEPGYKKWTRYVQRKKSFDLAGNLIRDVNYRWSAGTDGWLGNDSAEWAYDYAGHVVSEARYNRSSGNLADLHRFGKTERVFDSAGDQIQETHYYWDTETKTFNLETKDFYYYRTSTTGTQDIPADPIQIFPNPTTGILNLSGLAKPADVKIFSLQGMLIRTIHQVENTVDISDLPAGVYILNISESNHTLVKNFIIKE